MKILSRAAVAVALLSTTVCQTVCEVDAKPKPLPPAANSEAKDDPGCRDCVAKAASMFATRDSLGAAQLLQAWRARCPGNLQLHLLLSSILVRLGQHNQEAEDIAREATKINANSLPAHLQYALTLQANGKTMQAISEFERVVELDPASYEAWSSLGNLYSQMHDEAKSTRAAKKAAALDPSQKIMRDRQLRNLERAGRIEDIRAELRKLLSSDDTEPEACADIAHQALVLGAFAEGIAGSNRVLATYKDSVQALRTKALCQLYNYQYGDAIETAEQWLKVDAKSGEAHAVLGLAQLKLARLKEANSNLAYAAASRPFTTLTHLSACELDVLKGSLKDAAESLRKAQAVPSSDLNGPAHMKLAEVNWKLGKQEDALAEAREAARTAGLSSAATALEASIKMADQTSKDSQASGSHIAFESIAHGLKDPYGLLAEASFYLLKNKPLEARPASGKLIEWQPGDAQSCFMVYRVARALNDQDQQKQMLAKCLEYSPGDPDALAALAEISLRNGDTERAIELYRKVLTNREEAAGICLELAKALEQKGETEESIKFYRSCLSSNPLASEQSQASEAIKRLEGKAKSQ